MPKTLDKLESNNTRLIHMVADQQYRRTLVLVYRKDGNLGAAFNHSDHDITAWYDQAECNITFQESQKLVVELQPQVIIIPARSTTMAFQDAIHNNNPDVEVIHALSSEFTSPIPSHAKPDDADRKSQLSQSALSCLLHHMPGNIARIDWQEMLPAMLISMDALMSLQVISSQNHPNVQFSNVRSGISLIDLFSTHTSKGRALLRNWILHPLIDPVKIQQRLDCVSHCINLLKGQHSSDISKALNNAPTNIQTIITNINSHPMMDNYSKLVRFLNSALILANDLAMSSNDQNRLKQLKHSIYSIIDIDRSRLEQRVTVREKINHDLDHHRQKFRNLPQILEQTVTRIAPQIQSASCTNINVIYFPQLGFLVAIPKTENDHITIINNHQLSLQFSTEKVHYYKHPETVELDQSIGDVYADMVDLEMEIILQEIVHIHLNPCAHLLRSIEQSMAMLDCHCAFASFAIHHNLHPPTMLMDDEQQSSIEYRDGWHILQSQINPNIITNDLQLSTMSQGTMVITGPNSSGKSVYMKQTALIVYLAHIGSFVPAKSAKVSPIHGIYCRIQSKDSSSSTLSSFQTDLNQMHHTINTCTSKSLVLMDEFGKGTLPIDGIALLAASIKRLIDTTRPMSIVITHYHAISTILDAPQIAWKTMDMYDQSNQSMPLFKVVNGRLNHQQTSLALQCAKNAGLPDRILNRAQHLLMVLTGRELPAKSNQRQELITAREICSLILKDQDPSHLFNQSTS